jgi:predicted AAA+ superfamily ATPase
MSIVEALRGRVGSLISYQALAEDLQVSPHTIKSWIEIFEKMYLIFTVRAFTKGLVRSVQKPFKCYFYDTAEVENGEPAKFENLVALHLLQKIHYIQDFEGHKIELYFLRDKEKREIDFLIVHENKPIEMIKVKWKKENLSNNFDYFQKKLNIEKKTQIIFENNKETVIKGTRLTNPVQYFTFNSILKV